MARKKTFWLVFAVFWVFFRGNAQPSEPFSALLLERGEWAIHQWKKSIQTVCQKEVELPLRLEIARKTARELFLADKSLVYDDLYLHGVEEQFFLPDEYLLTLGSWYPKAVSWDLGVTTWEQVFYQQSESAFLLEGTAMRMLDGKNFKEKYQRDTCQLHWVIQVRLDPNLPAPCLSPPKILLVSPSNLLRDTVPRARLPIVAGDSPSDLLPISQAQTEGKSTTLHHQVVLDELEQLQNQKKKKPPRLPHRGTFIPHRKNLP